MGVRTGARGSHIRILTPAGLLSLRNASSKGVRVQITAECARCVRGFTDDNFIERDPGRCDLKDGALGPGGRRSVEEIVARGILSRTLCKDVSLEWSRRAAVDICAYGCRTGCCTNR